MDEKILTRMISGDETAFAEMINKYKSYVFAIILKVTHHSPDAADIAQEVFLQVFRSLHRYQNQNFKAWLGTIATHKAIDWQRMHERCSNKPGDEIMVNVPDKRVWANPSDQLLQNESLSTIRKLCQDLPDRYRIIIEQFYFQSRSCEQIAQRENISVRTVESRLYRARVLLREYWKEAMK